MIDNLREIIAIPSIEGEIQPNAPFGIEVRRALDWFLAKAQSLGLTTGENNGYYGWAEYGEADKPIIAMLCHCDVVPVADGWNSDPFSLKVDGDMLYGRGVSDDKGAIVMGLKLLSELKSKKAKLNHRVRLIVGCNEETGCACMTKYAAEDEIPAYSLVPDSEFPVTHCEKAILQLKAVFALDDQLAKNVDSFTCGTRANIVPDGATVKFKYNEMSNARFLSYRERICELAMPNKRISEVGASKADYSVSVNNSVASFTARGKAAHASTPNEGDNAAWKAWALLYGDLFNSELCASIYKTLCCPDAAKKLGVYKCDETSGEVTMNMGVTEIKGGKLYITFDFRLPNGVTADEVVKSIEALPFCEGVEIVHSAPLLYVDPNSPFIKTLINAYNTVTGEKLTPVISGGGTYAKSLPNAVAFGICPPDFDGKMHQANEQMAISLLNRALDIYRTAILDLDKI